MSKTKKEIIYISGPMRGLPGHNYPAFNALAKKLRDTGYEVLNPAENFGGDQGRKYEEYMQLDLQHVLDADSIALLPGWSDSEGARDEAKTALVTGKKFYTAIMTGSPGPYSADPDSWSIQEIAQPAKITSPGIDAEARRLVYGDRNADYGPPVMDFACTGKKWAATLSAYFGKMIDDIPPEIVSVMMMDLKTSRLAHKPAHYDSRVDVIGYALCHDRVITGK